jgi:hypothetical protein
MTEEKPPAPNPASGFERLQHDIEELERPVGRDSSVPGFWPSWPSWRSWGCS